ncbi:MAG: ABC-ATPase domain-containing protein [Oceanipulchritudo sp.]
MRMLEELTREVERLDGRGYPAYKAIKGVCEGEGFELDVLYVQGDPFASPSRVEIRLSASEAGYPEWAFATRLRAVASCDWINRRLERACRRASSRMGTGKGGLIAVAAPSEKVLGRTSVQWDHGELRVRLAIGLPAFGRRIAGRLAAELLGRKLPGLITGTLVHDPADEAALRRHVECIEDAEALRDQLKERGLVAFVADGSILPRASGVDDRSMDASRAIPFAAPETLRVTLSRPNGRDLSGMGLAEGVSLVVGGGFHGKSTLLEALQAGVYNHPPGDGREYVVTRADAVKIRAEDGRAVAGTDISAFIGKLPDGTDTAAFTTSDASGSTSQAAAIAEALEAGSRLLLIDEDTSATNFMIRDRRMQALINREGEPITPLVERIRSLFESAGVSTILVMGGSGDYFEVADTVIGLRDYRVEDLTGAARRIAEADPTGMEKAAGAAFVHPLARRPDPESIQPGKGKREVKTRSRALRAIAFGYEEIELDAVEQLVETGQLNAIAAALVEARSYFREQGEATLANWLESIAGRLDEAGPETLAQRSEGDFATFRSHELAAALGRLRSLQMRGEPAKDGGQ